MGTPYEQWFREPVLRQIAATQLFVSFAAQICAVALPTIAIRSLGVGPIAAAALIAVEFLPAALLSPWIGGRADVVSARVMIVSCGIGTAVAVGAVPLTAASTTVPIALLYVVASIVGVSLALNDVVVQRYLPTVTTTKRLDNANGAISAVRSIAQLGGPAIGGMVVGFVGGSYALCAAAAATVCVILLAVRLPLVGLDSENSHGRVDAPLSTVKDLVRILKADRFLTRMLVTGAGLNLFGSALGGLYAFYAYRSLGLSSIAFGVTLAAFSAAALVAASVAGRIIGVVGPERVVVLASVTAGTSLLLIPAASIGWPVAVLVLYQCLFGFAATLWTISSVGYRQRRYAPSILGRIAAVNRSLICIAVPVGAIGGGALASYAGVVNACLLAASLGAAFVTIAAIGWGRSFRGLMTWNGQPA